MASGFLREARGNVRGTLGVLYDPVSVRARNARAERLVLAAVAVLSILHCLFFFNSANEDGYISLGYARRWVEGCGLSLNDVAPSEGYSNPLWVALLAMGMKLGLGGLLTAKLLGVTCATATSMLAARLARACGGTPCVQGAAGIFSATATPLASWSVLGLETPLYALEIVVLALSALRLRRRRGLVLFAMTGGAIALTRPEGVIVVLGLCLSLLWIRRSRRCRRHLLWAVLLILLVVYAHQQFRLGYFGGVVCNSMLHKWHPLATSGFVARGLFRLHMLTLFYWSTTSFAVWLVLALPLIPRRFRRRVAPSALLLVALVSFHILVGGDICPYFRFLAPACVLAGVFLALSTQIAASFGSWLRYLRAVGPCLAVVLGLHGSYRMLRVFPVADHFYKSPSVSSPSVHAEVARWLEKHSHPGDRILLSEMGRIPFESGLPCFDYLGLTDRFMYGAWLQYYPERYDQHRPRFLVLRHIAMQTDQEAGPRMPPEEKIVSQPGFNEKFEVVARFRAVKTRSLMDFCYYWARADVRELCLVVYRRAP